MPGLLAAAAAGLFAAGPAAAGDEDMSPNAYQEFDPVTGYMVPVDQDRKQANAHGDKAATGAAPPQEAAPASAWPYWLLAGAAAAGAAAWLRRRRSAGSPS